MKGRARKRTLTLAARGQAHGAFLDFVRHRGAFSMRASANDWAMLIRKLADTETELAGTMKGYGRIVVARPGGGKVLAKRVRYSDVLPDGAALIQFPKLGDMQTRIVIGWGETKRVIWGTVPRKHRAPSGALYHPSRRHDG